MKEATGELNMTVVTIVAIAAIAAFFTVMWNNNIKPKIEGQWKTIDDQNLDSSFSSNSNP